jgi:hypothetical protein
MQLSLFAILVSHLKSRYFIHISIYYIWGALWSALLTKQYSGGQIEKNEMDMTCSTYGGEEKYIEGFGGETWGKETTWKTQA